MPTVNASAQLHGIATRLKAEGARGARLQLIRGMKAAAKPLVTDVQDAARRKLPKRGGLNEQVAGQRVTVSIRTGARTAGVRLITTAPDTAMTDSGFVRHPLPGNNRNRWVTQQIPQAAGWWSETLAHAAPKVTPFLIAEMQAVAAQINGVP